MTRDLQALVELAAKVCQAPSAAINMITDTEKQLVATFGSAAPPRDTEQVVVADARLVTPDDVVIGTLCVFDTRPRKLTQEQSSALGAIADRVVDVLELRLQSRDLERSLTELTSARDELRRSNEQLGVFAGQVSHDLRNPLTSVCAFLEMLGEQPAVKQDAESVWMVKRALGGAERMNTLIGELLEYAQVGGTLQFDAVDLNEVATEVLEDLSAALAGASVSVGELPVVHGDRGQLRAVLQNLIENAAKFTEPGTPPKIDVRGRQTQDGWRFEVADNGPGVPVEARERVFELFTRSETGATGSGIGLATCRRIVQSHGGAIGMGTSDAGGALVWVELPAPPGPSA